MASPASVPAKSKVEWRSWLKAEREIMRPISEKPL